MPQGPDAAELRARAAEAIQEQLARDRRRRRAQQQDLLALAALIAVLLAGTVIAGLWVLAA